MKSLAFYLPQFHPNEMNDKYWSKGFTDWDTTRNAGKLYSSHNQPFLPSDLGFYDLRSKNVIDKQISLATKYGLNGFIFYHYYFDKDVQALNIPINTLRSNQDLNINYCICWTNHNWSRSWTGDDKTLLYKQIYSNEMYDSLIENLCSHFEDPRYFRINNKVLLFIFDCKKIDIKHFKNKLNKRLESKNLGNVALAAPLNHTTLIDRRHLDFTFGYPPGDLRSFLYVIKKKLKYYEKKYLIRSDKYNVLNRWYSLFDYTKYATDYYSYNLAKHHDAKFLSTVMTGWDNTPRYKSFGEVFENFTPKSFQEHFESLLELTYSAGKDLILIKAWNEWAEGNVMEPSIKFGDKILKTFSESFSKYAS